MESKTTTKTIEADVTPSPYHNNPSHDGTRAELARLVGELVQQIRNDPVFRPPPLSKAALDAIIAYEVLSGAVNPVKASSTNVTKTKGG